MCACGSIRRPQRNVAHPQGATACAIVGPNDGEMACGEYGPGRMAEPLRSSPRSKRSSLQPPQRTAACRRRKVLITAGPTHEPIDPVRYIANNSSGKQGYALAEAAVALGAETILVSGPVNLPIPPGAQMMPVETAAEMLKTCRGRTSLRHRDLCRRRRRLARCLRRRIRRSRRASAAHPISSSPRIPDILKTVAHAKSKRPKLVVGFAAETENVIENAKAKLAAKGCDLIVANDVSAGKRRHGRRQATPCISSRPGRRELAALTSAKWRGA